MNYINYININTENIKYNIDYLKNNYKYKYYILDVSNKAFYHGMYLINYLDIDFLYVNNIEDLILVRKYNKDIPTIYSGNITLDNIYDLIMNNAILLLKNSDVIKMIDIKDDVKIMFNIDTLGYNGFSSKEDIENIYNLINNNKHFKFIGIMGNIKEEEYEDFKDIIAVLKDIPVLILNHERDKNKIKISNAIKLDCSIYGLEEIKKGLFKKDNRVFKQAFNLYTRVIKIKKEQIKKKEIIYGIIPLGFLNGMNKNITKVFINNNLYDVDQVLEEYSIIIIDDKIKINDLVLITGDNNPLNNYFDKDTINYLSLFDKNIPILYDDEHNFI